MSDGPKKNPALGRVWNPHDADRLREVKPERGNDLPAAGFFAGDFLAAAAGLAADITAGLACAVDLDVLVVSGVRFILCSRAKSGTGRSNALHHQRFKSFRQSPW